MSGHSNIEKVQLIFQSTELLVEFSDCTNSLHHSASLTGTVCTNYCWASVFCLTPQIWKNTENEKAAAA